MESNFIMIGITNRIFVIEALFQVREVIPFREQPNGPSP